MKQMRNLLMAHRHVPSRQELLSRPRNIPGYQEWKNSATPRAWIMRGQLRFSGAPKQALSNSEAASNERHGCFPRWQFGERHGKASTCTPSRQPPLPPAGRCFARARLQPFQTQAGLSSGCLLRFPCHPSLPRSIHLFFTPRHCPVRELHASIRS